MMNNILYGLKHLALSLIWAYIAFLVSSCAVQNAHTWYYISIYDHTGNTKLSHFVVKDKHNIKYVLEENIWVDHFLPKKLNDTTNWNRVPKKLKVIKVDGYINKITIHPFSPPIL